MKFRLALSLGAAATLVSMVVGAQAGPRAVVELFTSQGCSSCPAADNLLGELAKDPTLIVMSLPIDYWDYLGWKDTLAQPVHSARQRAYAALRGDRAVYTPQAVINGITHVRGNDRDAIASAIATKTNRADVLILPVTLTVANGELNVALPAGEKTASGEVWICGLSKSISVTIARGENKGNTVTYHNVVRRWIKVGDWAGEAKTWHVPIANITVNGEDAAAVIVQSGTRDKPGIMLGAALIPLH